MQISKTNSVWTFLVEEDANAAVEYALVLALILGGVLYAASSIFGSAAGR